MDTINLKLSTSLNRALNQDGITLLRSLSINQGGTYQVNLQFLDGSTPVTPSMGAFSFFLRTSAGANVLSTDSVTSQSGDYPYYFTISVSSPALASAIGASAYVDLQGVITYENSGELETITPFTIRVFSTQSATTPVYVSTINGLSSDLTLTGAGNVSVTQSGNTITIFGSGTSGGTATGNYYPLDSNPSGYLTSSALAPYATNSALAATGAALSASISTLYSQTGSYALQSALTATGNGLQAQISALQGQTGTYYPASNPSGYVGSSALSSYATVSTLNATSGVLQSQINTLNSQSGLWYPRTNPSGYVGTSALAGTVQTTGNQTISGVKTFANTGIFNSGIQTNHIKDNVGTEAIDLTSKTLAGDNWYFAGNRLASTWFSYCILTPSTDAIAASPASVTLPSESWGGANDGELFTVTINGNVYTFEFDNDSSSTNTPITIAVGDDYTTATNIVSAVNALISSYGSMSFDGSTLSISTNSNGASQSVDITATVATNSFEVSASGTDFTPASGTSQATLKASLVPHYLVLTDVLAVSDSTAGAWDVDIEIGYWDGSTFTRVFLIPSTYITNDAVLTRDNQITVPETNGAANWMVGVNNTPVVARSASGGTLAHATAGPNVTIYVRGLVY